MPLKDFLDKTGGKTRKPQLAPEEIKARFRANAVVVNGRRRKHRKSKGT